ncbi:helix-turn-helix domain-containing protein [Actinomadura atramentaria]|uniref:helix-turn-helix domain-containing protein n=1 Tax=Actinomadura atramentaria TaxID=1990 RepID=UPI00196A04BA|nr:helix-turn-helix transcriptional regulator [Actinomadura atramentaria]
MPDGINALTPGQRVAWHRVRRGLSQEVLAGLVGRTEDWLSKIENDRAALDRLSVIRALADALDVSALDLIGEVRQGSSDRQTEGIATIRAALTDYRRLSPLLAAIEIEGHPPQAEQLRRSVADVMNAYQASAYHDVLRKLPTLLTESRVAQSEHTGDEQRAVQRCAALAHQASAMILTKLGEADLAWIAAQYGLAQAERSGDPAIIGSLFRSVIHALHTQGRAAEATAMTRSAADFLGTALDYGSARDQSIYGTLLLPGAVAAARAGDRATANAYLAEAGAAARALGGDANHLWTAFGPTNVDVHRVTAAMSLGDVQVALDLIPKVDVTGLPPERRVRHAIEVAGAQVARNRVDDALEMLLRAEREAAEQVHQHVMSRQLVLRMRGTATGKRSRALASLASRMKIL